LLHSAELRKAFEERDIIPGGNTPEEFGAFIRSEVGKWRDLANRIGIKAE
jgi:tripartite-type tricarboxylate transporter receptor subunit TctC